VMEAVADLREQLKEINSNLLVSDQSPVVFVPTLLSPGCHNVIVF